MELCFKGTSEFNVKIIFSLLIFCVLPIGIINQEYVNIFHRFSPVLLRKLSTECLVMQNHKVGAYSSLLLCDESSRSLLISSMAI